jgi:hypothetical protein
MGANPMTEFEQLQRELLKVRLRVAIIAAAQSKNIINGPVQLMIERTAKVVRTGTYAPGSVSDTLDEIERLLKIDL